ncbi:MAG: hypothetical protein F6K31_05880 [Symploca sp. SIO2G7]|nr:hypothetical protein [Symploca sp. SIO2G7]
MERPKEKRKMVIPLPGASLGGRGAVDKEGFLRKTGHLLRPVTFDNRNNLVRLFSLVTLSTLSTLSCPNPNVKYLPL